VRHFKDANFSLKPAQTREAESIFQSVCEVVQREYYPAGGELHPHFTVIIGTEFNEVHSNRSQLGEI
jgi:hypothetical protein